MQVGKQCVIILIEIPFERGSIMRKIITIGRQFGTLGSEIGKQLSEITGIPCYDREALVKIAIDHGIPLETFEKADEQATSSFLYSLAMTSYNGNVAHYGMNDYIYTDRVLIYSPLK